jgi:hypothetical protein
MVTCLVDDEGNDVVKVWRTGGSNNAHSVLVATFREHLTKVRTEDGRLLELKL